MLFPIILCGGVGSRLWPASRELFPKPFIRIDDKHSLLQKTLLRTAQLGEISEITLVTNRDYFFKTKDEITSLRPPDLSFTIISEPAPRDTMAAISCAAQAITRKHGDDALLLIIPSDHLIEKEEAFKKSISQAVELAQSGKIVTFGISPTRPETGYGYIQAMGHCVEKFIEKPNKEKAQELISQGSMLWNSGMFCMRASDLFEEMTIHCPEILRKSEKCVHYSDHSQSKYIEHIDLPTELFADLEKTSFDYALMEKTKKAAVVPCDIGWSDIGDWNSFSQIYDSDSNQNIASDDTLLLDSKNCYIRSDRRLVAAIGLQNIAIIEEPDALLVLDKTRAQDVKKIFERLKKAGDERCQSHTKVHRVWGTYTILEEMENYKVKLVEIQPGRTLSLQRHKYRSEHWVVVEGIAKVVNGEEEILLHPNESTYIPIGGVHCLANPGSTLLQVIEVQCGTYLGEDDIERFDPPNDFS